jgi:superfamily II DNA/RNA helicase
VDEGCKPEQRGEGSKEETGGDMIPDSINENLIRIATALEKIAENMKPIIVREPTKEEIAQVYTEARKQTADDTPPLIKGLKPRTIMREKSCLIDGHEPKDNTNADEKI